MNKKVKKIIKIDPKNKDEEKVLEVYKHVDMMVEERDKTWNEFNDRTLVQFVDDGDKRLNAYTPDREDYDPPKEDWQANVNLPNIKNKQKRMLAGFSFNVPDLQAKITGEDGMIDVDRGNMAEWIIKGSYLEEENSILENFWEAWEDSSRGTVIKYEGFLKSRIKQKFIKSYNAITGEVEVDEREVDVDDRCISVIVPITEFLVWDFYIPNVQDQPRVAWVRYYDKDMFDLEFGKYKNVDKVKQKGAENKYDTNSFYYQQSWNERTENNKIEVIKLYDRVKDEYTIVANGILLLEAPLLWSMNGKKMYPFGKAIWEPFANSSFFYGNSFPNTMMGQSDAYNTMFSSILDKEFRSINPPLLIGRINGDALDLEDEIITGSTKIVVDDVSQIKQMDIKGAENPDVVMLQLIASGIEDTSPSIPSYMAKKNSTAREIVLADEEIKKNKNIYIEFLSDLWRQKSYIRLANIKLNYSQPRKIYKDGKEQEVYKTFILENVELEKGTGEKGTLAVQFRKIKPKDRKKIEDEISIEEAMMKKQGVNYRKEIINPEFLDNKNVKVVILQDSLYKEGLAKQQASVLEKLQVIADLFPQMFILNEKEYFEQVSKAFGDDPKKYTDKLDQIAEGEGEQPPEGQEGQGKGPVGPAQANKGRPVSK